MLIDQLSLSVVDGVQQVNGWGYPTRKKVVQVNGLGNPAGTRIVERIVLQMNVSYHAVELEGGWTFSDTAGEDVQGMLEILSGTHLIFWTRSSKGNTVGRVLNAWFNNCVVGKSGQSANPLIAKVDPVPYNSICARLCFRGVP